MFCNVRISLVIAYYEVLENILRQAYTTLASGYSEENYNQRFETMIVDVSQVKPLNTKKKR